MERYDSYKDSGVKWLGEIPSHWDSASLLYLLRAKISDGPHETPNLIEDGIPFISIDSLNDTKEIDFSVVKKFISYKDHERYCNKTKLEKGDVLFSKAATIGKTAIVGDDVFMVWSPLAILKPNLDKISSLYLYYIMNCKKAIDEVSMSGSKNTQINVGMRELEKIRIPIPTIEEQRKITHFLEKETNKIDAAIAQQQKMIDLLNERKQIIINNAVTKGLDPNVPMKDSGIDWLGSIPAHWELRKLKHIYKRIADGTHFSPVTVTEGLPYITATDVNGRGLNYDTVKRISYKDFENLVVAGCRINKGDILIVKDGATTGRVGIKMDDVDCVALSSVAMLTPSVFTDNNFLMYAMMSDMIKKQIDLSMAGAAMPRITLVKLSNYVCTLPCYDEQKMISDYIDSKIQPLDNAVKSAKEKISLLQERKQIIINDVVTGKVKVV